MSFPGRGCSTKSLGRRNCHFFLFYFSRSKRFAVRLAQQLQAVTSQGGSSETGQRTHWMVIFIVRTSYGLILLSFDLVKSLGTFTHLPSPFPSRGTSLVPWDDSHVLTVLLVSSDTLFMFSR